jgi:hypothetical protein
MNVSAFPVPMIPYNGDHYDVKQVGLTRREYFAIQIVSALLVSSPTNTANAESICEVVAKAFLVADQMERVSDRGSI